MAIDTSQKRQGALLTDPVVLPDGTVDVDDRANLLGQYGFTAGAVSGPTAPPPRVRLRSALPVT